ncbi:MAG: hypothetical protein IPN82_05730 [Chitinophagaceae bacterium]|nr:hypothetical protein [Chitinophagaceae bacterium]MBP6477113.1 hypothetical protein [Chitinophagaceae bacterium]MBP7109150.1 hypothetical protein [Chitinophagaceae bacterium]MBP7316213.1 hypothetical protein [Chitinophagaceae bacterium]HQX96415.1 hypothetical protein [Chitinophagaceae bacterium]
MKKTLFSTLFFAISTISLAQMVGNDKTKHGCITSAGYTYSFIKKDCIKVFEQEIKLLSVKDETSFQKQTCIIFSKNNKKAEVFLDSIEGTVLTRTGKKGNYTWKNGDITVGKNTGYYIKKGDNIIYSQ